MARFNYWLILLLFAGSCHQPNNGKVEQPEGVPMGRIIYDTFIQNNNPEDSWADECLAGFERKKFIDQLFKAVYSGDLKALDYFTGEKIAPSELRKRMEAGEFTPEKIAKVQFEEQWYWNENNQQLKKKVISATLAYEVFNNEGESRGYKPAFKVNFTE